jgi:hypothetical protein
LRIVSHTCRILLVCFFLKQYTIKEGKRQERRRKNDEKRSLGFEWEGVLSILETNGRKLHLISFMGINDIIRKKLGGKKEKV